MERWYTGLGETAIGTSPALLFDATLGKGPQRSSLRTLGYEVVAQPGAIMRREVAPGDLFIRRGVGEGRLAVASQVRAVSSDRRALEARGIVCEGVGEGVFVELDEGDGLRPVARRISSEDGRVRGDTALLRSRTRHRAPSLAREVSERTDLAENDQNAWILNTRSSSLELLPEEERRRFLGFAWDANDFPGGPTGPNEARAEQMFAALTRIRAERRPNSGTAAVLLSSELDDTWALRIEAALTPLAGQRGHRLHREAAASFATMRAAALGDGVTLDVVSSYRSIERARANATRANNSNAVASFSSHSLGLAVDLAMSHSGLRFAETSTRPFRNLVDMYMSPVHKWMFLRAETHGWFPYRREPWHWEYNPSGFRARFRDASATSTSSSSSSSSTVSAASPATPAPSTRELATEDEPTAADFASVAQQRATINEVRSQGLTLGGAVGAIETGNAPVDVRAVQKRLVEMGVLAPNHGEDPQATGTDRLPSSRLPQTIAALRSFQVDVRFWLSRRTIAGALSDGVVAPGDATAALLARVSRFTMSSGPTTISLRDHVRSGSTRSDSGVSFFGIADPNAIPLADFVALGLSAAEATALRFVSTHEGRFDAINTYDIARVSVGFIQFAGGRGLPPYLALLKRQQPAKFRSLLSSFGIDVETAVSGGRGTQVIVLDPAQRSVLRGEAAESAIRDDKRLTTALILSGRDRDVQLTQIAAATRLYVRKALDASVTFGSVTTRLGDLVRSERGLAMLFDRTIHEGEGDGPSRFRAAVQVLHTARPAATVAAMAAREKELLSEVERELERGVALGRTLAGARGQVVTLLADAGRAGATLTAMLARSENDRAREAVSAATPALAQITALSAKKRTNATDALRRAAEHLRLTPPPTALAEYATALTAAKMQLTNAFAIFANHTMHLGRISNIAKSPLQAPA